MRNHSRKIGWLPLFLGIALCTHCTSNSTSSNTTGETPSTTTTGIALQAAADFGASASASLSRLMKETTTTTCTELEAAQGAAITQDDPSLADGSDCDGDLGVVAHVTPTKYSLAFKRVTLKAQGGGTDIDLIPDTGTLANSEVVEFTSADSSESIITIEPGDLTAGTYTGIEAELYYFQMTFPVANTTQNVRIYMSDDDFTAEAADRIGLGPHHQGDITFINDAGIELGWVDSTWLTANLSTTRENVSDSPQNGDAGMDSVTLHWRGFFGDDVFWNAEALNQGANQDVYITTYDFDAGNELVIPDPATITDLTTITTTFSTADTFFYEDFSPFGSNPNFPGFYPDTGGEAAAAGDAWAPLAPTAAITYD